MRVRIVICNPRRKWYRRPAYKNTESFKPTAFWWINVVAAYLSFSAAVWRGLLHHNRIDACVITSYSIHYTKLYEKARSKVQRAYSNSLGQRPEKTDTLPPRKTPQRGKSKQKNRTFQDEYRTFLKKYIVEYYTICKYNLGQCHSGIMPMNRNVQANRVSEDWAVTFLQSVITSYSIHYTKLYERRVEPTSAPSGRCRPAAGA